MFPYQREVLFQVRVGAFVSPLPARPFLETVRAAGAGWAKDDGISDLDLCTSPRRIAVNCRCFAQSPAAQPPTTPSRSAATWSQPLGGKSRTRRRWRPTSRRRSVAGRSARILRRIFRVSERDAVPGQGRRASLCASVAPVPQRQSGQPALYGRIRASGLARKSRRCNLQCQVAGKSLCS